MTSSVQLTNSADNTIRQFINMREVSQAMKDKLRETLKVKGAWDSIRQDIHSANQRVQTITIDQKRLRDNMPELPKDSDLFKHYLKTLGEQEKEMEELQAKLKKLQTDEAAAKKAYDNFLANLTVE